MNTTDANNSIRNVYQTLNYWYNIYGSPLYREIIFMCFIPINITGFIFNVISYIVYRGKDFQMPVYKYIRIYAVNSAFICLILSTRFVNTSRRFLSFSNSEGAIHYYANFYLPILSTLTLFQASLDIILAFDRIVLFSNKYLFFKRLNPRMVCGFCLVLSSILMSYHWMRLTHTKIELYLNGTNIFTMHYLNFSYLSNEYATYVTNFISDVIPLCIEIPLNVIAIKALRNYIAKKETIGVGMVSVKESETDKKKLPKKSSAAKKTKRMEIKVSILVFFMSFLTAK
jgi:hypothetical protein